MNLRLLASIFVVGATCYAADSDATSLQAPLAGFNLRLDPPELRPIFGAPGAAVQGDPVPLPHDTVRLTLAPGQHYGIIERGHEGPAVWLLESAEGGPAVAIPGVEGEIDLIRFSPTGSAAVILSRGPGRLAVIGGLPRDPRVLWEAGVGSLDAVVEAAVGDSAESVLAATGIAVYRLMRDGSRRFVASASRAALAFLAGGDEAVMADAASTSVWLLPAAASSGGPSLLATALGEVKHIAATRDGRVLFLTDSVSPRVWSVSVADAVVEEWPVPVVPERLDALRGADSYLISSGPGKPAWILFRQQGRTATVFVPAAHPGIRHFKRF